MYNYDDQSDLQIYSFIFIPLSLFLSTSQSFKLLFFVPSFFNTAYCIYRSLVPALYSGKEKTGINCCSL